MLQGGGGALALVDGAFGADRGVVLVLDLQDVGIELAIVVAHLHPDLVVGRFRRLDGMGESGDVLVQIVVADGQGRLGIVLVAQVAHAQAGGVGLEQGVVKSVQLVFATCQEGFAQRRGGTEKIYQQPGVALKIAGQVEIAPGDIVLQRAVFSLQYLIQFPEFFRVGEVVMDAGDGLHLAAIAVAQTFPVDALHAPHVGAAVLGYRHVVIVADHAGHGVDPQHLITDMAVHIAVQLFEKLQRLVQLGAGWSNEFQQGFGIVRGDIGVGQRGAQRRRMWRLCQGAIGGNAQAFFLNAAADAGQGGGGV